MAPHVLVQGDTGHMVEERDSKPCVLQPGIVRGRRMFSFSCLVSVHLAEVVISHDSAAAPLAGLVVADLGPAWNIGRREDPGQDGQEYSCMEEVGRCPPAAVCDVGCEEEIDEGFLLEVSVV